MKYCSKCEQTKPLTEFYHNKRTYDGRSCYCIECDRGLKRERRNGEVYAPVVRRHRHVFAASRPDICFLCRKIVRRMRRNGEPVPAWVMKRGIAHSFAKG